MKLNKEALAFFSAKGKQGGAIVKKKYGISHFQRIARLRHQKAGHKLSPAKGLQTKTG
jgi:hypothetical protein